MKQFLYGFDASLKRIRFWIDKATGLAEVPVAVQLKIEVSQMDTRARLGPIMAIVGETVMVALMLSFRGKPNSWVFYGFSASVTACYLGIVLASRFWIRHPRKTVIFRRFQSYYLVVQALLGASWGGVIVTSLPLATSVQQGQIYAILIGLVSTAVFSGPAIYSLSFWTPIVSLSFTALVVLDQTNLSTMAGLLSYYALTFFAIFSLNRKLVDREINTLRVATQKEDAELLLREFQEGSGDWLWEVDRQFKIVDPSLRFCTAAGRTPPEMDVPFMRLFDGSLDAVQAVKVSADIDALARYFSEKTAFRDHVIPLSVDGAEKWWELSARPIFDDARRFRGFRGVARDVTEIQTVRRKVDFVAQHDALTGLLNRASFNAEMESLFLPDRYSKTHLLCVDLDHFKLVNDNFGHSIGDKLLTAVGHRLQNCLRHPGQAFRIGGDEFAVIISGSDHEEIAVVAKRIVDTLSAPYSIADIPISMGACIGIASVPDDGTSSSVLHHRADLALYRSKKEGRGTFRFFDSEQDNRVDDLLALQSELTLAVERQELYLEFQPIVEMSTGRIVSAEALLRWQHPIRGSIEPDVFIPLLERSGQITVVGFQVIEKAFRVAALIGNDISIAINLSPLQLSDRELPGKIKRAVVEYGIDIERIGFEVTESTLLDRDAQRLSTLLEVKRLGFSISLDDFGTGFSSMRLLNEFPFDKMKIDGSFTRGDPNDRRLADILDTMIQLGKKLGLVVVGEGVETEDQARRLIQSGCCEGQGFLFYRAMPAKDFINEVSPFAARRPSGAATLVGMRSVPENEN